MASAILGSRLFYVAAHPGAFRPPEGSWLDAIVPFRDSGDVGIAGLSVMGGFPAALLTATAYLAWKRLAVGAYLDLLAPSMALGAGITRLGCFANGCCFGTACSLPFAVHFPEGSLPAAVFGTAALHPTQLYQALAGFLLCPALLWYARRHPFPGAVTLALCVAMGLQRFAVELVRYNEEALILFRVGDVAFSLYQAVALGLVAVGLLLWAAISRRPRPGDA
jgi:phosphatidylglycerol:prolipoprotein diacylglycerol transferase